MEKYLVAIEFRYSDAPRYEDDYTNKNKEITIGMFDNFEPCTYSDNGKLYRHFSFYTCEKALKVGLYKALKLIES